MYAVYHGPIGLAAIAADLHDAAASLADDLSAGGIEIVHRAFFDTVLVRAAGRAADDRRGGQRTRSAPAAGRCRPRRDLRR